LQDACATPQLATASDGGRMPSRMSMVHLQDALRHTAEEEIDDLAEI